MKPQSELVDTKANRNILEKQRQRQNKKDRMVPDKDDDSVVMGAINQNMMAVDMEIGENDEEVSVDGKKKNEEDEEDENM